MSTAQVLREARRLIERGWCQDHAATTGRGGGITVFDDRAKRFCAYGAVLRAAGFQRTVIEPIRLLGRVIDGDAVSAIDRIQEWNDAPERTQGEVLAALDGAIALAEGDVAIESPSGDSPDFNCLSRRLL